MKPVNLMPAGRRAGGGGPTGGGAAYVVLGTLVAVLALVALLVHTTNGATERRNQAAVLDEQSARLEAQANARPAQMTIADVRRQRTDIVRGLALGRLDWERLVLETARMMPRGVWLKSLEATTGVAGQGAAGAAPAPTGQPAAGAASGATTAAPTVSLLGCSPDHARVADLLVRLRRVHGAEDVELIESKQADAAASGSASGGGTANECRVLEFAVAVKLAPPAAQAAVTAVEDRVPASLGGGQ